MTREQLLTLLGEVGVDVDRLAAGGFAGDLADHGLESLGAVEVALRLEEELGTTIPEDRFVEDTFRTVASIEQLVASLTARPSPHPHDGGRCSTAAGHRPSGAEPGAPVSHEP